MSSHKRRFVIEEFPDGTFHLYEQTENWEILGIGNKKRLLQHLKKGLEEKE